MTGADKPTEATVGAAPTFGTGGIGILAMLVYRREHMAAMTGQNAADGMWRFFQGATVNWHASCIIGVVMTRIDLHVHSRHSGDNDSDPEESVVRAIDQGLDGIAFTEHYSYGASEPVEVLREKYGNQIMIFRGVEFSSAEGHCLVFGVDTDRLDMKGASCEAVVNIVNRRGGVVIPSHPYRYGNSLGDHIRYVAGICAVEGYNGCNMHEMNARAVEIACALNLPYTGGSDAHSPSEVGSCYTEFDHDVTYENFIVALREGRYRGIDRRRIRRGGLIGKLFGH